MTDREQQIAIAEFCGFTNIRENDAPHGPRNELVGMRGELSHPVPDYLHDLNAIHEAEKSLDDECNLLEAKDGVETRAERYVWNLEQAVFKITAEDDNYKACLMAAAAQRAEALLRTIGKWKD